MRSLLQGKKHPKNSTRLLSFYGLKGIQIFWCWKFEVCKSKGFKVTNQLEWGQGQIADFFLRTPTLTPSNFNALKSTNPIFTVLKDLILFKRYTKNQEARSILKVVFALSKWPHLHRAYVVIVCRVLSMVQLEYSSSSTELNQAELSSDASLLISFTASSP